MRQNGHGRSGTGVRIDYGQPGVRLDLWGGTTQVFDGIDRFGRIIDQRWRVAGGSDLDRYQYGYDRDACRGAVHDMVWEARENMFDPFSFSPFLFFQSELK